MSKRVAVVGAGPSGLVTTKELLAEGHEPTCFERANGLGGVFRFDETDGVVWESCSLTSSPLLASFSDFPAPADRLHMKAGECVDYLERYCQAFDLHRHVRFGTTVESVTPDPTGGSKIRFRDAQGTREERFDSVALLALWEMANLAGFLTEKARLMSSSTARENARAHTRVP